VGGHGRERERWVELGQGGVCLNTEKARTLIVNFVGGACKGGKYCTIMGGYRKDKKNAQTIRKSGRVYSRGQEVGRQESEERSYNAGQKGATGEGKSETKGKKKQEHSRLRLRGEEKGRMPLVWFNHTDTCRKRPGKEGDE